MDKKRTETGETPWSHLLAHGSHQFPKRCNAVSSTLRWLDLQEALILREAEPQSASCGQVGLNQQFGCVLVKGQLAAQHLKNGDTQTVVIACAGKR